jgi:phosphate transport system permease protein
MTTEQKRKIEGFIALLLSSLAAAIGLFWLVYILSDVLTHGLGALTIGLFFNDPAPAGVEGGGLRNAFIGQLMITACSVLIGVPVGVLGGTFLAEYAREERSRASSAFFRISW